MTTHYNAFISYRHHPDDIKVAAEIHRSLERFHVPGSLRKKYGKINRLFRDKEELPITSDLNDDIDDALRNSDYLIVICSVHLKESVWCQREIERFLQTHPRNRVLTVLASGEPYDVIPDILLHEDVVDPETGEIRRIDIEPLSCDWRVKRRKAKQEELLRLAAPLLGCAYDELRQRQKQYKARRNATIITSALVASFSLTAYFLYTSITIQKANIRIQAQNEEIQAANIQIQKNLDEALINQSRHLATAAEERLAEGDRLTAIALATAALPGESNVRPYVPEAERVLAEALMVYNTDGQVEAVGTVTPGANVLVNDFRVSESEKTVYLRDHRKIITAWDAATLQKLGEITLTDIPDVMTILNNENLVVHNGMGVHTVSCYQPDGTPLWQMDNCPDVTYMPEQDLVLVIRKNDSGIYELIGISGSTGEPVGQPLDLTLEEPEFQPSGFVTTPGADMALIRYYKGFGEPMPNYAVDLRTGDMRCMDLAEYPSKSVITQEGYFVAMGQEDGLGVAAVVEGNRVTTPGTKKIYCYDLHTGRLMWEKPLTAPVGAIDSGIFPIQGSGKLLCVCGNMLMVVDAQTGETIAQCGTGSVVKAVYAAEKCATLILQDGYIGYYYYDYNYCYEIKAMADNVSSAVVQDNCYSLRWQEDHVTVYQNIAGAPAWESLVENGFSANNHKVCGSYLAFQDSARQYVFDMEKQKFLHIQEKGQKDLLGFSADGKKLWYAEGTRAVTEMDIATGKYETVELELREDERVSLYDKFAFFGECLYYTVKSGEAPKLVRWNLRTGQKTFCSLQVETEEDIAGWYWEIFQAGGDYVWLLGSGKMMLEADLRTGKTQIITAKIGHRPVVAVYPERDLAAVSTGGKIYLKKPGQDGAAVIELENANAGSMCFREELLLALCDNGFVYRFDLSGKLLGQTELWVGSQFSSDLFYSRTDFSKLSWQFARDNTLVVNALGEGNVIDCESWTVKATVSNFLLYHEKGNFLVCKAGSALAGYTLYNTEQLLKLAEEDMGSFQMTQEQKTAYGIN